MKNSISKTKMTATIVLVVLMASVTLMAMPVEAQVLLPAGVTPTNLQEGGSVPLPAGVTPDYTLDTTPSLSCSPNPVGVGQTILVNLWLIPPIHVSRYFIGYTVTITKPDGTVDTVAKNSYRGDSTTWFEYVVDQVGTWKLKFDFPGGYFPPGNYTVYPGASMGSGIYSFTKSCYYAPSSTKESTLTVQKEQVLSWPPSALPTDYWTRPISPMNREWWPIAGYFPGTGVVGGGAYWPDDTNIYMSNYMFVPYVQAPNSAHIVWKRQDSVAGLIGGPAGQSSYGWAEVIVDNPTMVYAGRCYTTMTIPKDGVPTACAACYDIRTGEMYYAIPISQGGVTPTFVEYCGAARQTVPGAESGFRARLFSISGGRVIWVDPWTGALTLNFSIAPLTTANYYDYLPLFLSVQDLGAAAANVTGGRYRLINWTLTEHYGTPLTYSLDVMNNITWPWSSLPNTIDFESGIAANIVSLSSTITGTASGFQITAASLETGKQLWNITGPGILYSGSCSVADHGKIAVLTMDGYYRAWDLRSGTLVWKSETMEYPWDTTAFGAYAVQSAYGLLYHEAYSGIYAFNWTDGKIAWKYEAPATPFETPYVNEEGEGTYSWDNGGKIADGKLYVTNLWHLASSVIPRGWKLHCINATTGAGIWNITYYTYKGAGQPFPGGIGDGYLAVSNQYDGYMYVFGKGKSATTVTAPLTEVSKGSSVMIEGTILDQSPAQPGTPCVSKDSMETQMEYLHLQMPIDGLWHNTTMTGVPVSLTAIASDGNYTDIGTVVTDPYHGTFDCPWTPPSEGTYRIIASFVGDDSYGSSGAATAITVGPAPTQISIPQQSTPPDYTMTIIGGVIAVIVAVIIAVAAVGIILYRKK